MNETQNACEECVTWDRRQFGTFFKAYNNAGGWLMVAIGFGSTCAILACITFLSDNPSDNPETRSLVWFGFLAILAGVTIASLCLLWWTWVSGKYFYAFMHKNELHVHEALPLYKSGKYWFPVETNTGVALEEIVGCIVRFSIGGLFKWPNIFTGRDVEPCTGWYAIAIKYEPKDRGALLIYGSRYGQMTAKEPLLIALKNLNRIAFRRGPCLALILDELDGADAGAIEGREWHEIAAKKDKQRIEVMAQKDVLLTRIEQFAKLLLVSKERFHSPVFAQFREALEDLVGVIRDAERYTATFMEVSDEISNRAAELLGRLKSLPPLLLELAGEVGAGKEPLPAATDNPEKKK